MTVEELKTLLNNYPNDMEIFHSAYHDKGLEKVTNISEITVYKQPYQSDRYWDETIPYFKGYEQKQALIFNLTKR